MAVAPMVPGLASTQFYPPLLPQNFINANPQAIPFGNGMDNSWNMADQQSQSFMDGVQQGSESEESENAEEIIRGIMLLIPFFIFPADTAAYFGATELIEVFLKKLGVSDKWSLLFILFVQCVDVKAFARGRFKVVDGWESNYYGELWDSFVGGLGYGDIARLGSQYLLPQSPKPTYED